MSLKIECDSTDVELIKFTDKKNVQQTMRKQEFFWHKDGVKYPVQFSVSVDEGSDPLPEGIYELNSESLIDLNQYGSLSVNGFGIFEALSKAPFVPAKPETNKKAA